MKAVPNISKSCVCLLVMLTYIHNKPASCLSAAVIKGKRAGTRSNSMSETRLHKHIPRAGSFSKHVLDSDRFVKKPLFRLFLSFFVCLMSDFSLLPSEGEDLTALSHAAVKDSCHPVSTSNTLNETRSLSQVPDNVLRLRHMKNALRGDSSTKRNISLETL